MSVIRQGPMSEALKDYLDASKSTTQLIGPLEKWLLRNKVSSGRSHRVLHPSEVASDGWCPRYSQEVMEDIIEVEDENHRLRMQSIFAEGHAIHAKWQDWLGRMGVLYGIWRCTACGVRGWNLGTPRLSEFCEHSVECIVYDEVPLNTGIWGGHADGIVTMGSVSSLLEIKSIGTGSIRWGAPHLMGSGDDLSKQFSRISQPFPSHIRQIQIYMELADRVSLDEPDMIPVDQAIVLYECKSDQSAKEFVVQRDSSYIEDILGWADEIEELLGTGTIIECPYTKGRCQHVHE